MLSNLFWCAVRYWFDARFCVRYFLCFNGKELFQWFDGKLQIWNGTADAIHWKCVPVIVSFKRFSFCRWKMEGSKLLASYLQTNEQGGEQSAFMVNLSENSVWQRGFRQVCATLGTETFQEERKKAIYMFFEVNGLHLVTDWLWKIFNISSSASDRWTPFSRRAVNYIYCAAR